MQKGTRVVPGKQKVSVIELVVNNSTNNSSSNINKNALGSVESRLFVDKIRSEEVNRARAFVTRGTNK